MIAIIKKTVKICNIEIYTSFFYRLLINSIFLLLIISFQFGDITLKVTSNYLVITWISINVYFIFSMFIKSGRAFLLDLSSLTCNGKLLMLYMVAGIMNVGWLGVIFLQLVVVMKATILNAMIITIFQYIFALAIGSIGGVLYKKYVGIVLIIGIGLYNFIYYNPLIIDGSAHFLSISEQLYAVNVLNSINIISLSILVFLSIFATSILLKSYKRFKNIKLVILIMICLVSYIAMIFYDFSKYECLLKKDYATINMGEATVEYKNLSIDKVSDIYSIVSKFEKYYQKVQGDTRNSKYIIDKRYLSAFSWKLKGIVPEDIIIDDDIMYIHVLSDSMIYFENDSLLINFIEQVKNSMVLDIEGYNNSKYTRHLIEGYSFAIMKDVSSELDLECGHKAEDYYSKKIETIFNYPTTKFNFVYRVGLIIYTKFPDLAEAVYKETFKNNPKSDREFIELLEDNFIEIVKDEKMQSILNQVYKE